MSSAIYWHQMSNLDLELRFGLPLTRVVSVNIPTWPRDLYNVLKIPVIRCRVFQTVALLTTKSCISLIKPRSRYLGKSSTSVVNLIQVIAIL